MAVPVYATNDVPTATEVNVWFVNTIAAVKTANESVTSSTTLQNDDELFVSVAVNSTYMVHCLINCDGASTGDIKIQFTGPAGATFTGLCNGLSVGGATGSDDQVASIDIATAKSFGLSGGAGLTRPVNVHGNLVVTSTAGTFRLQWAQDTSDATATRVLTGSHLVLQRIS